MKFSEKTPEKNTQELYPAKTQKSFKGPAEWFIGDV
jgi:4-carboxymuconolactone decarboxylase